MGGAPGASNKETDDTWGHQTKPNMDVCIREPWEKRVRRGDGPSGGSDTVSLLLSAALRYVGVAGRAR
jgi:hypothetical protein